MIAYRRNKNLKQIIGSYSSEHNKKTVKKKYYSKCLHSCRVQEQCCKQVIDTKSYKSTQKKPEPNMFHNINCKIKRIIYPLECNLCKIQYVGKNEGSFNFCLNSHRKDDEHANL